VPVPPNIRERSGLFRSGSCETAMRVPGLALGSQSRHLKGGHMKTIAKYATAMALTGALAVAAASPSEARHGRNAAAIGFGVVR
jgi:hypothetical protein